MDLPRATGRRPIRHRASAVLSLKFVSSKFRLCASRERLRRVQFSVLTKARLVAAATYLRFADSAQCSARSLRLFSSQVSSLSPLSLSRQASALKLPISPISALSSLSLSSLSKRCRPRRAISRILSASRRSVWLCVHLSTPPKRSSRRSEMRHTRDHRRAARSPILPCTGMGLSSLHRYLWSGELLPPLFTLTSGKPEAVIFCDTIRHGRFPCRAPVFTGNPALWCPDFPLTP